MLRHALHGNKLRLGHSRGNRFVLTVRGVRAEADGEALAQMVAKLGAEGLPNFYGPQRFGPAARNVARGVAWLTGEAPAPRRGNERRFVVSAVQSALFNAALRARMAAGDVRQVRLGDVLQVVRSGGPFWVDDVARETARLQAGEVVPTGPMFGRKMRGPRGVGAQEEAQLLARAQLTLEQLASAGPLAEGTRRPLWVAPAELRAELDATQRTLVLQFALPPGSYATGVLHELECVIDGGPGAP